MNLKDYIITLGIQINELNTWMSNYDGAINEEFVRKHQEHAVLSRVAANLRDIVKQQNI